MHVRHRDFRPVQKNRQVTCWPGSCSAQGMELLNDLHYVLTNVPHAASFIIFLIISLYLCLKNA